MWLLPAIAPSWFSHLAIDGSSTRALWLQVMGPVQVAIGLWYLGRQALIAMRTFTLRAAEWIAVQGAEIAAGWQGRRTEPAAASPVLDFSPDRDLWANHAAVVEMAGNSPFRSLMEKARTTEERVAEYIATESQRRLALRAGSLAAYAAAVPPRQERRAARDAQRRVLRPASSRQPQPELQSAA